MLVNRKLYHGSTQILKFTLVHIPLLITCSLNFIACFNFFHEICSSLYRLLVSRGEEETCACRIPVLFNIALLRHGNTFSMKVFRLKASLSRFQSDILVDSAMNLGDTNSPWVLTYFMFRKHR